MRDDHEVDEGVNCHSNKATIHALAKAGDRNSGFGNNITDL